MIVISEGPGINKYIYICIYICLSSLSQGLHAFIKGLCSNKNPVLLRLKVRPFHALSVTNLQDIHARLEQVTKKIKKNFHRLLVVRAQAPSKTISGENLYIGAL